MTILLCLILLLCLANTGALVALALYQFRQAGIKKVLRPSTELDDFLTDIKRHGYGVIRLEPDSLISRGSR